MFINVPEVMRDDQLIDRLRIGIRIPDRLTRRQRRHFGGVHIATGIAPFGNTRDLFEFFYDSRHIPRNTLPALIIKFMNRKIPV